METSPTSKIEFDYDVTMPDSIYFKDPPPSKTIKVEIYIESNNLEYNETTLAETQTNSTETNNTSN